MSKQKLIVILGQTASGKTALSLKLAKKLALSKIEGFNGAEIISADSRQVYKGMDIATAKPWNFQLPSDLAKVEKKESFSTSIFNFQKRKDKLIVVKGINHHLIDVVYPNEEFNVAIYKKLSLKAIKGIQKRGKLPFLVGGTGLYIQTIVDNIEFPKVPPQKKLREKLEKKSAKELFEIYQKLDPEGAKFIEKENPRRLIRAIEICKVTGKPFSGQRKKGKPLFDVLEIGIKLNGEELKKRVAGRVEKMIKLGLEKEVKKLVKKYGFDISPMQTIGYQEWLPYFEGKITKEEVKEKIKTHTLQFAKRQMTWFKKDKRIKWVINHRQAERLLKEFLE
jgi:tRNA dimethylallyltransferase